MELQRIQLVIQLALFFRQPGLHRLYALSRDGGIVRNINDSTTIHLTHLTRLLFPIGLTSLNNAKRVNPEVLNAKLSGNQHRFSEHTTQRIEPYS
jgi:hypothetical protein